MKSIKLLSCMCSEGLGRAAIRSIVAREHIHTPNDGRGFRDVFVDGKKIPKAFYADTKKGVVRAFRVPFVIDKRHKRALSYTVHGKVTVVIRNEA